MCNNAFLKSASSCCCRVTHLSSVQKWMRWTLLAGCAEPWVWISQALPLAPLNEQSSHAHHPYHSLCAVLFPCLLSLVRPSHFPLFLLTYSIVAVGLSAGTGLWEIVFVIGTTFDLIEFWFKHVLPCINSIFKISEQLFRKVSGMALDHWVYTV